MQKIELGSFAGAACVLGLAVTLGCGVTPVVGESCSTPNAGTCEGDSELLICLNSTWTAINCRGAAGCLTNSNSQPVCDQSLGREGEACFTTTSGNAACSTEGTAQLACTGGTFQKVSDCLTCQTTSGQVVCQVPFEQGQACTATDQCADAMTCFPEPPGSTSGGSCRNVCGPGAPNCDSAFNCVDQGGAAGAACVPAPSATSQWKITVVDGNIPATKPDGASWDTAGQPDPVFCVLTSDRTICTGEISGTFTPAWNYTSTMTFAYSELATAQALFWDNDSASTFTTCEQANGNCDLGSWSAEVIFNDVYDLSPQWAGHTQLWTISYTNGARVSIQFVPQ